MRTARGLAAALLLGLLMIACKQLPPVPAGTCGNHVIEPPEDCDGFPPNPTSQCRPKGTVGECRLDCRRQSDGSRPACPSGWGCDPQGICRAPTGSFDRSPESPGNGAWSLMTGDFDGDGRADIISLEQPDVRLSTRLTFHYFDDTGLVASSRPFPKLLASPVIANLSAGPRSDLVFTSNFSVGVLYGQADRGMVPETFSSYHFPDDVLVASILDDPIRGIAPVIALTAIDGVPGLYVPDQSGILRLRGTAPPGALTSLVGEPASGDVIEDPIDSPCREMVMAVRGASSFTMVDACTQDPIFFDTNWREAFVEWTVALDPPANIDAAPRMADMNGDGHLDVLVGAGGRPYVAYGDGHGLTVATPYQLESANPLQVPPLIPMPLAAGDFTGDGAVDFVFEDHLLVSIPGPNGGPPYYFGGPANDAAAWTVARIVDLNGNGKPDVVAASSHGRGIDFFNGTGTINLLTFHLPTNRPVPFLAVSDLDGDLIKDVAFVEAAAPTLDRDSVMIAFGDLAGPPSAPVSVARIDQVQQLIELVEAGVGNLLVTSTETVNARKSAVLAVLGGSGDRLPFAPYMLVSVSGDSSVFGASAMALTIGRFVSAGRGDVMALTTNGLLNEHDFHFWLLPALGVSDSAAVPIGGELDPRLRPGFADNFHFIVNVVGATADIDGDGRDESLWVMPADGGAGCGLAIVGLTPPGTPPQALPRATIFLDETCPDAQLLPVDADGDGALDIVLLTGGPGLPQRKLLVLWNDGTGGFSASRVSRLGSASDSPEQFTVLPATAQSSFRFIYVTDQAVTQLVPTGPHQFGRPKVLSELRHGSGVVAADIDGDGVLDLAVADSGNVSVLKAELAP